MIIAGDIGGTKTVIAQAEIAGDHIAIVREHEFAASEHASLEDILERFVPRGTPIEAASFGVAGPVDAQGRAKITNLPWTIDAAVLSERLAAPVGLLNDLQATALGHLVVPPSAWAILQAGDAGPTDSIAVIAPGTGLGESLLVHDGREYVALPSEGGHADFAPTTEDEIHLLRFLRTRHGEHVSYERVLSGNGIGDLYDFVRERFGEPEPAWLAEALARGDDRNAVIGKLGVEGRDTACVRAVQLFVEALAAEAGNLALRGVALGGVSIGGGIPPKLLPALQDERFTSRFVAKGRFAAWMRARRVRVCLEPRAAMLGAARHALKIQRNPEAAASGPPRHS